jgi:hypothetical protein
MQAFLWRHLVPAEGLKVLVFDPAYTPPPKRVPRAPPTPPAETKAPAPPTPPVETKAPAPSKSPAETKAPAAPAGKAKFTKQQVANRLRELKALFEDGLLTDDFYNRRVAECETAQ